MLVDIGKTLIDPKSLSYESIAKDLKTYIEQRPDKAKWKDFYESSTGTIIIQLIAGLGAFKGLHELIRRRESYLDQAVIPSSIYELAFNRGFFVPTFSGAKMTVTFRKNTTGNINVTVADQVATIGEYYLYALENKAIYGKPDATITNPNPIAPTATIECIVGVMNLWGSSDVWETAIGTLTDDNSIERFKTLNLDLKHEYAARELEKFVVKRETTITEKTSDGETNIISTSSDSLSASAMSVVTPDEIPLSSELVVMNNTTKEGFLLRRLTPNLVSIYIGNGYLGWAPKHSEIQKNPDILVITDEKITTWGYRVISYDRSLENNITLVPESDLKDIEILGYEIVQLAQYPEIEAIRKTATYYPLDGRCVTDKEYEAFIMKYFATSVRDVFAENTDPTEHIHLLVNNHYYDEDVLSEIEQGINSRRALGIKIIYHVYKDSDLSIGKSITLNYKIRSIDYNDFLLQSIVNYLDLKKFQFARTKTTYTPETLAIELSANFGVGIFVNEITPTTITLEPTDYFRSINVNLEVF